MKTGKNIQYPQTRTSVSEGTDRESASRIDLINAILSDIGVPECMVSRHASKQAVRESQGSVCRPVCHIVAGANGSGKSTFALYFLP